jgi:methylase of polypeptide subunit release factors
VGGESGLDVVDRIIASCCDWLRPGGRLVIEVGVDQVDEVARRFEAVSLSTCGLISDDGGDLRGVCGTRP